MNISVKEYKPSHRLSDFIETYWIGTFNVKRDTNFSQHVVPNGCIELILHISHDHCMLNKFGNSFYKSPPHTLLGIYSKPYIVKFSAPVNAFGIRFYPDGFRNILGVPPAKFLSNYEDGSDVVGKKLGELLSRIQEEDQIESMLQHADLFFLHHLAKNQKNHDYTHLAMKIIRRENGIINFEKLTEKVPISLRQLQREFRNTYGITITEYIRLSRLNAIHKYMLMNNANLSELAHHLEFTDQSHFIREFRYYMGMPPKKFIRRRQHYIINAV